MQVQYGGARCPGCDRRVWIHGAVHLRGHQDQRVPIKHFRDVDCLKCEYRGPMLFDQVLIWQGGRGRPIRKSCVDDPRGTQT